MKIQIITSCTGEKLYSHPEQLIQEDFRYLHSEEFDTRRVRLAELSTAAEDLYTGQQHVRLMDGVRLVRERVGDESVNLYILSAGYGLIPGTHTVVPYECTFQGMKKRELSEWSAHLRLSENARRVFATHADLTVVLLGDSYIRALGLDDTVQYVSPTIFLASEKTSAYIHGHGPVRTVKLSNREAKLFSCGLTGLKGELGKRILKRIAEDGEAFIRQMFKLETDVLTLLDAGAPQASTKQKLVRANPTADRVISIPDSWWDKTHRKRLRYFIPEWDDLVDPDYHFITDTHSGGGGDWSNEVYAHQMYPEPNYDGILVSKVVAEKSAKKRERINRLGVHRYLRVPRSFPVMGDCGAFGYIMDEEPPYSTDEILDYYTRLDFDYGVSIDHLIVKATEGQKQFRYDLTINNAEEFLREHRKRGLQWTPIGAVQGWDAQSYAEAARKYVAMGYKYIALGGMVRTSTKEILQILEWVHQVVPKSVDIHLFGVARMKALSDFARLGIRSVDSASYLRQAWMRLAQSYLSLSGEYAALRIPEAGKSFRAKRMQDHAALDERQVQRLERNALKAVRALADHRCSVDNCLNALLEYDQYVTSDRVDMTELYRKTLTERPWERCECALCRMIGVEIIIFRGNNRNRRRGFHNTYIFYRLAQKILNTGDVNWVVSSEVKSAQQMPLFLGGELSTELA